MMCVEFVTYVTLVSAAGHLRKGALARIDRLHPFMTERDGFAQPGMSQWRWPRVGFRLASGIAGICVICVIGVIGGRSAEASPQAHVIHAINQLHPFSIWSGATLRQA